MNLEKRLCAELKRQLETKGADKLAIPAGGELLWRWFLDLNRSRTYHMSGPNPISHQEIVSYRQAMRWPIEPRHVAILRAMDEVWMGFARKEHNKSSQARSASPRVSSIPLTAEAFDAMFS